MDSDLHSYGIIFIQLIRRTHGYAITNQHHIYMPKTR